MPTSQSSAPRARTSRCSASSLSRWTATSCMRPRDPNPQELPQSLLPVVKAYEVEGLRSRMFESRRDRRYLGILSAFTAMLPAVYHGIGARANEDPTEYFLTCLHLLVNVGLALRDLVGSFKVDIPTSYYPPPLPTFLLPTPHPSSAPSRLPPTRAATPPASRPSIAPSRPSPPPLPR